LIRVLQTRTSWTQAKGNLFLSERIGFFTIPDFFRGAIAGRLDNISKRNDKFYLSPCIYGQDVMLIHVNGLRLGILAQSYGSWFWGEFPRNLKSTQKGYISDL
jgi:hypothetical protein